MGHAYALGFAPYTVSASSEHPEMPASNVAVLQHPRRPWQADTTTTEQLTLDLGVFAGPTYGLYVSDANFDTLLLETSSDGSSWTSYPGGPLTIPADPTQRQRRHGLLVLAGVSTRYLRLTCSGVDAGEAATRLGVLAVVATLYVMTARNFDAPIDWVFEDPHTRLPYANRGFELHSDGGRGKHVAVLTGTWVRSLRTIIESIQDVGIGNPWLLQETIGDMTRAWIVTQTADIEWREISGTHFAFRLPIEEFA